MIQGMTEKATEGQKKTKIGQNKRSYDLERAFK